MTQPEQKCDYSLALEAMREIIDGPDGAMALRQHRLRGATRAVRELREERQRVGLKWMFLSLFCAIRICNAT